MPKAKSREVDTAGRFDRLPDRERVFTKIKEAFGGLAAFYGFEAVTPSLAEEAQVMGSLQKAGVLSISPVTFRVPSGKDYMLRTSGCLGVIRAYLRHKMNDLPHPLKFLFSGEKFSASKGEGSLQAATELGLCMIGEEGPIAEAEIVQVIWKALEKIGFDPSLLKVRVNATSCPECRPSFRTPYLAYVRPRANRFCKSCRQDLKKNPTAVLRCREETCRQITQNAPQVLDYLCEPCKKHLRGVLEFLDEMKIPYLLDPKLFKDGTLYSNLVFEIVLSPPPSPENTPPEGEKSHTKETAVAEGGRMSRVGEALAGRRLDVACGVTILDTLEGVLSGQGRQFESEKPKVFFAQLGELAKRKSLELLEALRSGDIPVYESLGRDAVKSQLKVAERMGAEIALILGQKEALDNTIIVREIQPGVQETIAQEKLVEFLKRKLKK